MFFRCYPRKYEEYSSNIMWLIYIQSNHSNIHSLKLILNHLYDYSSTMILLSRIYGQPGIRLLRNNRVIEGTSVYPNVPDNLLGTKNKYAAQRIYGELELNDFPVDFMKTRFNDNMKDLFGEISKRLSNYHYNILK